MFRQTHVCCTQATFNHSVMIISDDDDDNYNDRLVIFARHVLSSRRLMLVFGFSLALASVALTLEAFP